MFYEASGTTEADRGTPVLRDARRISDVVEWGKAGDPVEGNSNTSGILLHRNSHGSSECEIWICTPRTRRCRVERDEFCYFLEGSCTYSRDNGETVAIFPDSAAFFESGWSGTCTVLETIRKVYMIS